MMIQYLTIAVQMKVVLRDLNIARSARRGSGDNNLKGSKGYKSLRLILAFMRPGIS